MQTTLHFILADFGSHGTAFVERDPNDCDRETTINDLISGEIEKPLRVIEVDFTENTSRDVTEDVAREIADRASAQGFPLRSAMLDFIHDHVGAAYARALEYRHLQAAE